MHPDTHEEGGLGFTNKQLLDQQRAAVLDIFKEVRVKSPSSGVGVMCTSGVLTSYHQSPASMRRDILELCTFCDQGNNSPHQENTPPSLCNPF